MTDDELGDVIALAVHTMTAPLLAKIAMLEARPVVAPDVLEFLKENAADLRMRMIAVESRALVPGPQGDKGDRGDNGKDADESLMRKTIADYVAQIPAPKDGKDGVGLPGKDADPAVLTEMKTTIASLQTSVSSAQVSVMRKMIEDEVSGQVARQVTQIPPARDGKDGQSVTVADLAPVVAAEVKQAVAALPKAKDGTDGRSVTVDELAPLVTKAVSLLPTPKDGQDGRSVTVDELAPLVTKAVSLLPTPKDGQDGRSVTVDELAPVVVAEVAKAIALVPAPRDGVGLTGAVIDRDGHLVLMLTDGQTKDVGPVVGKDGSPGLNGTSVDPVLVQKQIADAVALIPKPKDGKDGADGLGFDDFDLVADPQRGFLLRLARGDQVKDKPFPTPFDTGVWKAGRAYEKGSGVTYKGAWWIAQWATSARPGDETPESRAWRLAVKGGRDGAPGKDGRDGIDR